MLYVIVSYLFYPLLRLLLLFKGKRKPQRVLVVQRAQIGDLIYSSGIFREIKKALPDVHITAMVNPLTKGILENNPHVDRVIYLEKRHYKGLRGKIGFPLMLREGRYDAIVALNPRIQYAVAPLWALIPIRVSVMPNFANISRVSDTFKNSLIRKLPFMPLYCGISYYLASRLHTNLEYHVPGRLLIRTYLNMLRPLGITADDISKDVYSSPGAPGKVDDFLAEYPDDTVNRMLVGLGISSGKKMKELGTDMVAAVAAELIRRFDASVVLVGSRSDSPKAADVMERCAGPGKRIIDSTGRFRLDELPALIERMSVYVGVDSGISYMADSRGIPLVVLAGPADMTDQCQTGDRVVIIEKELPCAPCSHPFRAPSSCATGKRECIGMYTVEEVMQAADKLLRTGPEARQGSEKTLC